MEEYRFEHKEPLTQRVVLALRVNTKQLKEHLWLGTEYEVGTALRSLDKPLYLAQTRPLGAFWCEFGKSSAEGWTEAVWALCEALSARKTVERDEQEQKAAELLSRLTVGNAAALYAAIQIWEMYLRCCRGRDKHKAEAALRDYAQLLSCPLGNTRRRWLTGNGERLSYPCGMLGKTPSWRFGIPMEKFPLNVRW